MNKAGTSVLVALLLTGNVVAIALLLREPSIKEKIAEIEKQLAQGR